MKFKKPDYRTSGTIKGNTAVKAFLKPRLTNADSGKQQIC